MRFYLIQTFIFHPLPVWFWKHFRKQNWHAQRAFGDRETKGRCNKYQASGWREQSALVSLNPQVKCVLARISKLRLSGVKARATIMHNVFLVVYSHYMISYSDLEKTGDFFTKLSVLNIGLKRLKPTNCTFKLQSKSLIFCNSLKNTVYGHINNILKVSSGEQKNGSIFWKNLH